MSQQENNDKKNGFLKLEAPEEIGAVEVCCQWCRKTIAMWSPLLEVQLGRGWLDKKVKEHRCS